MFSHIWSQPPFSVAHSFTSAKRMVLQENFSYYYCFFFIYLKLTLSCMGGGSNRWVSTEAGDVVWRESEAFRTLAGEGAVRVETVVRAPATAAAAA